MKTREQIRKKIENAKETLEGLKATNPLNSWCVKQIAIIENRIKELEWVAEDNDCISKVLEVDKINSDKIEDFLQEVGYFQKDESGIYSYISENERHLINLKWVLEAYGKYIKVNK